MICSRCKVEKTKEEFYKDKRTTSGHYSDCKKCHNKITSGYMKNVYKKTKHYKQYQTKYRQEGNRLEYHRIYSKKQRDNNPSWRLDKNIVCVISTSLKGIKAGRKWQGLVGYTLEDLRQHLEGQFDKKMSWENYGSYWHVDHIKPRSLFKFTKPEDKEFKECWELKNLQPLERIANLKKHNKFTII